MASQHAYGSFAQWVERFKDASDRAICDEFAVCHGRSPHSFEREGIPAALMILEAREEAYQRNDPGSSYYSGRSRMIDFLRAYSEEHDLPSWEELSVASLAATSGTHERVHASCEGEWLADEAALAAEWDAENGGDGAPLYGVPHSPDSIPPVSGGEHGPDKDYRVDPLTGTLTTASMDAEMPKPTVEQCRTALEKLAAQRYELDLCAEMWKAALAQALAQASA